jgi:hypothetical protein
MRTAGIIGGIVGLLAIAVSLAVPRAHAQTARPADSGQRVSILSSGAVSRDAAASGEILREIDDPHNGDRWLLIRDDNHSAGPARLVLVSAARGSASETRRTAPGTETPPPLIRAGDRVVVEEHSSVVDAHLEAVAMEPAWAGSAFNARLSIGGQTVRAVAAATGRATLQQETRQEETRR